MSQSAERGLVQRILARVYDRIGSRIVLVLIGLSLVICSVTSWLMLVVADGYLDLSRSEFWLLFADAQTCAIVGPLLAAWRVRDAVRDVLVWSGPDRTAANAPAAWNAVAVYPATICRQAIPVAIVLVVASSVFGLIVLDLAWWAVPVFGLALLVTVAGSFVVVVSGLELVLHPMLEDIAAHLPADFEPAPHSWTIHAKTLAPLPIVTMIAAIGVPGFAGTSASGAERLAATIGISLVIVGIATAIFFIVTRSSLDPIVDLTAATKRAREGDLSATVPVVSADDLGHLAADFNQMLLQLRESQARIVAASDAARRQVERDLHDGAQQELVLLNLKLGMIERAAGDETVVGMVREAREDLSRALHQLRDLAHGIYPATLENDGLAAALTDVARRTQLAVDVQADEAARYPRELEAAVYFCCLEALQNAAKHAGDGANATVRLAARNGSLDFEVCDDGPGFDAAGVAASSGLQNMTDRIGALGGTLIVDSGPGTGTTVRGRVPVA